MDRQFRIGKARELSCQSIIIHQVCTLCKSTYIKTIILPEPYD